MSTAAEKKTESDASSSFSDELKPGTVLMHGQYTIESFLNSGGFGITYLARDSLDRKVVIKECFPGSFCRRSHNIVAARSRAHQAEYKSIVKLFVKEAFNLSKLNHPNIVGVHHVFEDNDTAYMALDFVEGYDLLETLEEGGQMIPPEQVQPILEKLLDAIGFIHGKDMLHRDISPDNILLDAKTRNPVLIDFGAAREEATKKSRVLSAMRVVKDGYSPQEFYIQGSKQGPYSDLYALGATFYHLTAGETPPNSQARLAAIAASEPDPYVPLSEKAGKGLDPKFLAAVDRSLAVFPKDRLQSAAEWLAMLKGEEFDPVLPKQGAASTQDDAVISATVAKLVSTSAVVEEKPALKEIPVPAEEVVVEEPEDDKAETEITAAEDLADKEESAEVSDDLDDVNEFPASSYKIIDTDKSDDPVVEEDIEEDDAEGDIATASDSDDQTDIIAQDTIEHTEDDSAAEEVAEVPVAPHAAKSRGMLFLGAAAAIAIVAALGVVGSGLLSTDDETAGQSDAAEGATSAIPVQRSNELTNSFAEADIAVIPDGPAEPAVDSSSRASSAIVFVPRDGAVIPDVLEPVSAQSRLVVTGLSVDLPFTTTQGSDVVIKDLDPTAADWMREGQAVVEVNGTEISDSSDLGPLLQAAAASSDVPLVQIQFGLKDSGATEITRNDIALPVVQEVALLNGIEFQSKFAGEEWQTVVTSVPENNENDLQVGDIIVAYIPTSERVGLDITMAEIMTREVANEIEFFNFAVSRDNFMWVASFNYSTEEQ
ncbi:serine/threonine-protein kinase [Litoreibacter roseus]|uniref:Protein kinase domain-containing protein n=1 Tax=Litoreibacter roseus TaxID=2601869 RepID=A0A6N6JEA0_9RHOB|nr:serine/threonine-protein kinase [Litoreibacter roseus]GFE64455.1 hypothetical protein KIN_15290 [Litoreibacter roseus]